IVAIAGGSGVTPFRSMIREIAAGKLDLELLLLYGSRLADEIIFAKELEALAAKAPQKIRVEHVISEPAAGWDGLKGFIDAALIREYAGELSGKSFFVCGPPEMYRFLQEQFAQLGLPRRQIRWELAGAVQDITAEPGYPAGARGRIFQLHLRRRGAEYTVPAAAEESILTALERAGLAPDSQCRSGECGFCRSLLTAGEVYVRPESDGRRAADRRLGFIHPCASYPLSDLSLTTP
ncbi:MAG TPA: iron-sulfur cluster-binding domain-containing protein, partial [Bacillota bacterium]|nr:iron-sulfur cluster-binding domain-containing protein [Bacillota bacterium]